MAKDLFIRKQYTKNDINVVVEIDLEDETISLVDNQHGEYQGKKWLFSGRGVEYMQGWLDILGAMEYAITEATKVLKENAKVKELENVKFCNNLADELNDET